jgi:hypothetical protein
MRRRGWASYGADDRKGRERWRRPATRVPGIDICAVIRRTAARRRTARAPPRLAPAAGGWRPPRGGAAGAAGHTAAAGHTRFLWHGQLNNLTVRFRNAPVVPPCDAGGRPSCISAVRFAAVARRFTDLLAAGATVLYVIAGGGPALTMPAAATKASTRPVVWPPDTAVVDATFSTCSARASTAGSSSVSFKLINITDRPL